MFITMFLGPRTVPGPESIESSADIFFKIYFNDTMGPGVAYWLRRCATSRTVPGSIPGGVTWDFFRGSFRQNYVP